MNVKQIVIDRIQEELKAGRIPWQSPYLKGKGGETKCNFISGHSYRGMNELLLAYNPDVYYMTFKQCQEIGAKVKKGAKSNIVTFWKINTVTDKDNKEKTIPILNYYRIFGISDIDFSECEEKYNKLIAKRKQDVKDNKLSLEVSDFIKYTGAIVKHKNNSVACYYPVSDYINMPSINMMSDSETYTQVLFHELTHWTGHTNRLNRIVSTHKKGKEYSKEELVAELGACFLCAEFGITPDYKNSAAYIQSWSSFIKENSNAIFSASTESSKAVEYLKEIVSNNIEITPTDEELTESESIVTDEEETQIEDVKEVEEVKEEKLPESGKTQEVSRKNLNVSLFKKYINTQTYLIEVSQKEVKYFTIDNSVIIFNVNVDTDKDYIIPVHSIRKDIKKCKGQILFRDNKIITDSCIVNFESLDDKVSIPVSIPQDYMSGFYPAVSKVIHASATDTIKPVFNAICLSDNKIVATDSRRLAMADFKINVKEELIITKSVIDIAIKDKLDFINVVTLQEKVDTALIIDIQYVVISNCKDVTIISKEVSGKFPNFKQIIPNKKGIIQSVKFNPSSLMSFLQFKKGTVIFKGDTLTHKDTEQSIKLPFHSSLEFGINSEFLKDCLKDKKEISMSVSGVMSPVMFKSGDLINIVMPIQIKQKEESKVA